MPWTRFFNNNAPAEFENTTNVFIEAPLEEAKVIFYNRLGHNPDRVSCTCYGEDFLSSEYPSLEDSTAHDRNAFVTEDGEDGPVPGEAYAWQRYIPLDVYLASEGLVVIKASEIKAKDRKGEVPKKGWVWVE